MATYQIRDFFEERVPIVPSGQLTVALLKAAHGYLTKNQNHVEFFGGHLTGTPRILFVDADRESLFEALDIDDPESLAIDFKGLPIITPEWKTRADIFHQLCIWVVYKYLKSNRPSKEIEQVTQYVLAFYMAKVTSGVMKRGFPSVEADPTVAQSVFESLDNRTLLKEHGSWLGVYNARAKDITHPRSKSYKRIMAYDDDSVGDIVGDIASRMFKMIVTINLKYYAAYDAKEGAITASKLSTIDGETIIKDVKNGPRILIQRMDAIARDPNDFLRAVIVDRTMDVMQSDHRRYLEQVLNYYADNYVADKDIQAHMEAILVYMVSQAREGHIDLTNIPEAVRKLQSIFRSSNTRRKEVLNIKSMTEKIVQDAVPKMRKSVFSSTKIALFVYIVIRALASHVDTHKLAGANKRARVLDL